MHWVLAVICVVSRFIWLTAIPNKTADAVEKGLLSCRCIIRAYASRTGLRKIMNVLTIFDVYQHDWGQEFSGKVKQVLEEVGAKRKMSKAGTVV